jgi:glutathione-independent formaldehyde dehydrogenase
MGCETVDISKTEKPSKGIAAILKTPYVDAAVECVGSRPTDTALMQMRRRRKCLSTTRSKSRGWPEKLRFPVSICPKLSTPATRIPREAYTSSLGLAWVKGHFFGTGQCPAMRYNREFVEAILDDRIHPGKALNVTFISLDEAPQAYRNFDKECPGNSSLTRTIL